MDDTNPGNKPLEGAPGTNGPQPPQYQRQPQNQWNQQSQNQWGQPQYQQQPYQQQYQQQPYPQQYQQQPQQQWAEPQQPVYEYEYEEEKKSKGGLIAAILAVLVLIAAGVLAWGYFQQGWFSSENSANGYSSSRMTESAGSGDDEEDQAGGSDREGRDDSDREDREDRDREDSRARPEDPDLPSNAVPVNDAARSGEPAGDFNNVYRGSDVTSEPFSLAVRDKFVEQWMDTRDGDATIEVYSTVTGQSYTMDCSDNGKYITCTGGNNAIVYIA